MPGSCIEIIREASMCRNMALTIAILGMLVSLACKDPDSVAIYVTSTPSSSDNVIIEPLHFNGSISKPITPTWVPLVLRPMQQFGDGNHILQPSHTESVRPSPLTTPASEVIGNSPDNQSEVEATKLLEPPKSRDDKQISNPDTHLKTDPEVPGFFEYFRLAETYFQKQQYQRVIDTLNLAIEGKPRYAGAYLLRGRANYHLGNNESALRDFDFSIKLNGSDYRYYLHRGIALAMQMNPGDAVKDYDTSILLNPQNPEAYTERAWAYRQLGEVVKSNKDYYKACEIDNSYCAKRNELNICSKSEKTSTHIFYGKSRVEKVIIWSDDEVLASKHLGGTPDKAMPYNIGVMLCNDQLETLVGKSITFKYNDIILASGLILTPGKTEEIDLLLPQSLPPTPEGYEHEPLKGFTPTPTALPEGVMVSPGGMLVTLYSVKRALIGDVSYLRIEYSLRNVSTLDLPQKGWKIYFDDGGGVAQQSDFALLFPGQVLSHQYTFKFKGHKVPFVLGYPSRQTDFWDVNDLTWKLEGVSK